MSLPLINSANLYDILERGTNFDKLTDEVLSYLKPRYFNLLLRKTRRAVLISVITDDFKHLIIVIKSDLKYWAHVGDLVETNFLLENLYQEAFFDDDDDVDIDVIDREKYQAIDDLIDENPGDLKIGFKITNGNVIRFYLVFVNGGLTTVNVIIRKDNHVPQSVRKFVTRIENGITRTNINTNTNTNVNRPVLPPCRRWLLSKDGLYRAQ